MAAKLFKAAQNNDVDMLEKMGREEVRKCGANKQGRTLLHAAVQGDAGGAVRWLLGTGGVDPRVPDREGDTPVTLAVKQGAADCISAFAAHNGGALLAEANVLSLAVRLQDRSLLQSMLGGDVGLAKPLLKRLLRERDGDGLCAIHLAAAQYGCEDILEMLLEHAPDLLELADKQGRTPLLVAAQSGSSDSVAFLLKHGANINVSSVDGKNVLHLAAQAGSIPPQIPLDAVSRLILSPDLDGNTPLHLAALSGNHQLFAELKKMGGGPAEDKENLAGKTPAQILKNFDAEDEALLKKEMEEEAAAAAAAAAAAEEKKRQRKQEEMEAASIREKILARQERERMERRAAQEAAEASGVDDDEEVIDRSEENRLQTSQQRSSAAAPQTRSTTGGSGVVSGAGASSKPKPASGRQVYMILIVLVIAIAIYLANTN